MTGQLTPNTLSLSLGPLVDVAPQESELLLRAKKLWPGSNTGPPSDPSGVDSTLVTSGSKLFQAEAVFVSVGQAFCSRGFGRWRHLPEAEAAHVCTHTHTAAV